MLAMPEIHAEEVLDLDRWVLGDLDRGVEVELTVNVGHVHLTFLPVEPLALVLAEEDRDALAAFQWSRG